MSEASSTWTFLSNHAHVLILLARDPALRMRDLAERIGVTERAVQRIVSDLSHEGYIEVTKSGRRNHYRVLSERPLRHPVESGATVGCLISLLEEGR